MGCVEYLLVEEDRNEKFVVKLSVCVNAVKEKQRKGKCRLWVGDCQGRFMLL